MFHVKYCVVLAALIALSGVAHAQTVVNQPVFVPSRQWVDIGNGPTDIQPVEGNGELYSSLGTGVGSTSGSSTTLTLTGTPPAGTAPCVGCIISGTGITSGTTVAAFNGTTTITLSAAMTVASMTPLSWGSACPAATAANVPGASPNTANALSSPLNLRSQGAASGTYPMYTQARICAYGLFQNGFTFVFFPIGAH